MIIRRDKQEASLSVANTLGRKLVKGDVGIEIELEASSALPKGDTIPGQWTYHQDGSLRGYDNAEYVLAKPLPFDEVDKAVDALWEVIVAKKSKLDTSNRTSVHVHLNVGNFFLNRLTVFMSAYFVVEEILTQWCGEHRVGNLFCLRAKDAPAIVSQLRRFIRTDMQSQIRENFHYAGLNANALFKFGSIEIRSLRGVKDPTVIKDWVSILRRIHAMSADYPDPRAFVEQFSALGPIEFFSMMLGEHAPSVQQAIGWTDDQVRDSLYDGIRIAQDLCYCRDWSTFKATEITPDPFGRDPRRLLKSAGVAPAATFTAQPPDLGAFGMGDEDDFVMMDEGEPDEDFPIIDIESIPPTPPVQTAQPMQLGQWSAQSLAAAANFWGTTNNG